MASQSSYCQSRSAGEILFLEKLTDLLNLLQSRQTSSSILFAFRSSNIITLNKDPHDKHPIRILIFLHKMSMALAIRSLKLDFMASFRQL